MTERGATFWKNVDMSGECWTWKLRRNRYGYGQASWGKNKSLAAHRAAWFLTYGSLPEGLTLDHLCRNRVCVRPDHLEPVSRGDNVRRGLLVALRTHCKRGHELTPESIVPWAPSGAKWCLRCYRAYHAAYRARHREQKEAA